MAHLLGAVLIGLGAVVGIGAMVWAAVAQPKRASDGGLVDVQIGASTLSVLPRGFWKIAALRTRLTVPLDSIVSCKVSPGALQDFGRELKLAGTGFPGVRTGFMVGADGRSFWVYGTGANAVVITLDDGPLAFIVIEVDDPDATARSINSARLNVH